MNNRQEPTTTTRQSNQGCKGKYRRIVLGLDVHADLIMVVRIVENAAPQPAQRFSRASFQKWVKGQLEEAESVHSCYEAGPFGYGLHRSLVEMGIKNVVVQPVCLDERRTGVNNDKTDARELAQRLDRYVAGNDKAIAIVRVPSPEEEERRALSRQREQLKREIKRIAAQGRGVLLTQEIRQRGDWWKGQRWEDLQAVLPKWLRGVLERFREVIQTLAVHEQALRLQITAEARATRPKGVGSLTLETANREVGDWGRFTNRRQVGSFTGLVGGVSSSGASQRMLSITKHGNVRLRTVLVEAAWRLLLYQPQCRLIQKWKRVFGNPHATKGARKKAIVGIARQLAVDLWRWQTGRVKPEDLGWEMMEA